VNDAWKLRAIVYGMLLVVAALVLVPRLTASGEAQLPKRETLWGYTAEHSDIVLGLSGRHIDKVLVHGIYATCVKRPGEYVGLRLSTGDATSYREDGGQITISSQSERGARVSIRATLRPDAHHIYGTITYAYMSNGARCTSAAVAFSASR
jgi:hypothetical protein